MWTTEATNRSRDDTRLTRRVRMRACARALRASLESAGVPVEFVAVAGEGHAIHDRDAYVRIAAFFDMHLGGRCADILAPPADPANPSQPP